jgi:hypothetical protein
MEKAPPKSLRQTQGHGSRLWSDMVVAHGRCDGGVAGVSIAMHGSCGTEALSEAPIGHVRRTSFEDAM